MSNVSRHPASFKDPAGYVFEARGSVLRQVNKVYAGQYQQLMQSGLYDRLTAEKKLLPHSELTENITGDEDWYTTLLPEQLSFISYPYEWSFDELKDAALLTLSVLRTSIEYGMILKDATPFNIQFHKGRPVFIDTLSFDVYDPSKPWVAYRQFCETFLFPLYLEHYLKIDCIKLLSTYLTGIPVEVTAKMLPAKSKWSLGVRLHVLLQNNIKNNKSSNQSKAVFSRQKLLTVVSHLESIFESLKPGYPAVTTWSNYYEETILGKEYLIHKEALVKKFCSSLSYRTIVDMGANDGHFARLLAEKDKQVIAADIDSRCINTLYLHTKQHSLSNIIALIADLSNPSPAVGFNNAERSSLQARLKPDLVLVLALVHHLVIGKNIPLILLAPYFASFAPQLIIEFVPKEDEKVKQLLSTREDIFTDYHETAFERNFLQHFTIQSKEIITGTSRILYCLVRK